MRLKDWIETLEALPKGAVVVFDDGDNVGPLISWRGIYAQLTLPTAREPWTVKELLKDARGAVGSVYTGYKGGDYVMDESTPVWADDYGRCTYRMPTGVADKAGKVVVATEVIRDEYREMSW